MGVSLTAWRRSGRVEEVVAEGAGAKRLGCSGRGRSAAERVSSSAVETVGTGLRVGVRGDGGLSLGPTLDMVGTAGALAVTTSGEGGLCGTESTAGRRPSWAV